MADVFWNDELKTKSSRAVQLKREGHYLQANEIYQTLDRKYPNNALLLFSWAKTVIALEKFDEAKYVMERAKELYENLDNPEWWQCAEHIKKLSYEKSSKEFQEYMRAVSGNREWVLNNKNDQNEKTCPVCAKKIKINSTICCFCNTFLDNIIINAKDLERKNNVVFYDGKPFTGLALWRYADGPVFSKENYKDGKLNGECISYHGNGQVEHRDNYRDGKLHGEDIWYYENGTIETKKNYIDGELQ